MMNWQTRASSRCRQSSGLIVVGLLLPLVASAAVQGIEATYAQHTHAVELARAGKYDAGLDILRQLLREFPRDYPLNRDYILISTWKGDCAGALTHFTAVRDAPRFEPYFVSAVADCAVQRARGGEPAAALAVLNPLAAQAVENYPLQRDVIVINAWRGDCPEVLRRFDALKNRPIAEDYFAIPVADCLLAAERPRQAARLLREALIIAADDVALNHALSKSRLDLPELDDPYRELMLEFMTSTSDQGLREWRSRAEVSTPVATETRLFARHLVLRAADSAYRDGDLQRFGLGLRHWFNERCQAELEISNDVQRTEQGGIAAQIRWLPRDAWEFSIASTNFAEDLPLRARATGVTATSWQAAVHYHSLDYVWEARGLLNHWDYSDNNQRNSAFATAGYAYDVLPYREQHLYIEWYQSRNTLDGAPYFNPRADHSLGLLHRTDFIYDTRYRRHVDNLSVAIAAYDQEGYGTRVTWQVNFTQDYDLDDFRRCSWGVGYGREVYDGAAEYASHLQLSYGWRF